MLQLGPIVMYSGEYLNEARTMLHVVQAGENLLSGF